MLGYMPRRRVVHSKLCLVCVFQTLSGFNLNLNVLMFSPPLERQCFREVVWSVPLILFINFMFMCIFLSPECCPVTVNTVLF